MNEPPVGEPGGDFAVLPMLARERSRQHRLSAREKKLKLQKIVPLRNNLEYIPSDVIFLHINTYSLCL